MVTDNSVPTDKAKLLNKDIQVEIFSGRNLPSRTLWSVSVTGCFIAEVIESLF